MFDGSEVCVLAELTPLRRLCEKQAVVSAPCNVMPRLALRAQVAHTHVRQEHNVPDLRSCEGVREGGIP